MTGEDVAAAIAVAEMISRELDEDYVGLWKLPWHLRRQLEQASDELVRTLGEAILRGLASSGVRVGDLSETTGIFDSWPQDSGVDMVVRRWAELGRDPNIGEIAWLARQR